MTPVATVTLMTVVAGDPAANVTVGAAGGVVTVVLTVELLLPPAVAIATMVYVVPGERLLTVTALPAVQAVAGVPALVPTMYLYVVALPFPFALTVNLTLVLLGAETDVIVGALGFVVKVESEV